MWPAIAIAVALNRSYIAPRIACYCDRYWTPLENCRVPGAIQTRLPYTCPQDHVLDPLFMTDGASEVKVRWREYSMLDNPRCPGWVKRSRLTVYSSKVGGAGRGPGRRGGEGWVRAAGWGGTGVERGVLGRTGKGRHRGCAIHALVVRPTSSCTALTIVNDMVGDVKSGEHSEGMWHADPDARLAATGPHLRRASRCASRHLPALTL